MKTNKSMIQRLVGTAALAALIVILQLVASGIKIGPFTNKNLNLAAITSVVLVALVMFIPGLNTIFGLIYLSWQHYLIGLGLIFVPLLVMEVSKALGLIKHHGK